MERGAKIYNSPIGEIEITSVDDYLTGVNFCDGQTSEVERVTEVITQCMSELDGYFNGSLREFNVKFYQDGTVFRKGVWEALCRIPYGETISYKQLAEMIGNAKAVRAVGGANHNNKIGIIVPCHRVIGANKELVGYGGGVWRKEWLLAHEKNSLKEKLN